MQHGAKMARQPFDVAGLKRFAKDRPESVAREQDAINLHVNDTYAHYLNGLNWRRRVSVETGRTSNNTEVY